MSEVAITDQRVESAPPTGVGRWHYLTLALIILLGAVLRFAYLDHPGIWGDEAATWARTVGTFEQMLEANRQDGFVPLHYEMYWAMAHLWKMTPFALRLVPAIAGVLMVPAMYFLARQLVRPSTALVVALLTATSAYYLNYSRDAKMYMQAWLAMTIHMGCLLWWLRGGRGVAWWCWVAAGVAAVGLHASTWLVIPLGTVFVLTHGRPRVWRWIFYPIGMAIIGVGPYVYYTGYNTWKETSGGIAPGVVKDEKASGNWFASGIAWIDFQTQGKTGPMLVRDSASAYLYGYSRAEEEPRDGKVPIPDWVQNAAWGTFVGIAIVFLAGMVRWPGGREARPTDGPWWSWQVMLWLSAWIVVPTYGFFYCRSIQTPDSPTDWLSGAYQFMGWRLAWLVPLAILLGWAAGWRRWLNLSLAWGLGLSILAMVLVAVIYRKAEWYLAMLNWTAWPARVGAMCAVAAAVSWASCGTTFVGRLKRLLGGVGVAIAVLLMCEVSWLVWDHLREVAKSSAGNWRSIWMPRYLAVVTPAMLIVLGIALVRLPGRAVKAIAIAAFIAVNLIQYGARIKLDPEPRVDLIAKDVAEGDRDPAVAVFVRDRYAMGAPGTAAIADITGRFYLFQWVGGTYTPTQMRNGPTDQMLKHSLGRFHSISWIKGELARRPEAQRLILWDRESVSRNETLEMIQQALGDKWELVGTWAQNTRRHWNWQDMDSLRRMEFKRIGPPPEPAKDNRPLLGE